MKTSRWRGRLMLLGLSCMALVAAGGCVGLSDRQLSTILQSVVTSGLTTLVSMFITGLGGTTG